MGYTPIVSGRRTLPFSWCPRDKLREVVTLGCYEYPEMGLDGRHTVRPPTRITVAPRSGLDLPPSEDIWVELHDNIGYPIQQLQFVTNGFDWMIPQSLGVYVVVEYSDNPKLVRISGVVVVACFLKCVEDRNNFVYIRIREPVVPRSNLKRNPVSQNTRGLRQKLTYQRPQVIIQT